MNYWICICRKENDDCKDLNEWLWDFSLTSKYMDCFGRMREGDKILCFRQGCDSWYEFAVAKKKVDSFVLSQGKNLAINWNMTLKNTAEILAHNPKKYYAFQKEQNTLKFIQATLAESSKEQFEMICKGKII